MLDDFVSLSELFQSNKNDEKAAFERAISKDKVAKAILEDLEDQYIEDMILDEEECLEQLNCINIEHNYAKKPLETASDITTYSCNIDENNNISNNPAVKLNLNSKVCNLQKGGIYDNIPNNHAVKVIYNPSSKINLHEIESAKKYNQGYICC